MRSDGQSNHRHGHSLRPHSPGRESHQAAQQYLSHHKHLTISLLTRFEILRGLYAKQATRQIESFATMCGSLEILPVSDDVVLRAAEIYGQLHRAGQLVGDADILIAATGMENGLEVATNNEAHFERISGLRIQNWLR